MKCQVWKCDVCGRQVNYDNIICMKAKSGSFVTFRNCDDFFADRKNYDICTTCLEHIGAATRGWVDRDGRAPNSNDNLSRMVNSYSQCIKSIQWEPEYSSPQIKPQSKSSESEMHMELDLLHDTIWFRYDNVGFCVQVPHGVIKKLKQQKEVKII